MTFVEKVLAGEEFVDSIDDYVDQWHEADDANSLAAFLGFTDQEYSWWVEQPRSINHILLIRRRGVDVKESDWSELHLLAARAQQPQDKELLTKWLRSKNLI